jgi:malonyl-CoA O-methyltransferase
LRPVPADSAVELLWANMTLHMAADPQALIRQWHEALAVDGFLMFSCFGPDTLRELRALYQALGWPPPAHEYTDMHDWGDMLVGAGFAEPVMDMERIELTFESPQRLLQELRELGRNLHPARAVGLLGRAWQARLHEALVRLADPAQEGRLKLTFEVIYGHAFKPQRRLTVAPETRLSLDEMRGSLRRGRGPSGG